MKPFRYLPKTIRVLILINLSVFLIAFVLGSILGLHLNIPYAGDGNIRDYIVYFGAFFPTSPLEIWRYLTYMFVHIDFWHFVFNMLMLWMFGDGVLEYMGVKHFISMYLFCGVFAAFFSFVLCIFGLTNNPIIGASGALMGIFVACYRFFPESRILLFFFFPMKLKHAMWVMIVFDLMMAPSGDGIAHFAHLGGVFAGFIYMFFYEHGFDYLKKVFNKTNLRVNTNESFSNDYNSDSQVLEGEVFYMNEEKRMNEILDKVNKNGIHSLSEIEKQFLLKAGEKMKRRRGGL